VHVVVPAHMQGLCRACQHIVTVHACTYVQSLWVAVGMHTVACACPSGRWSAGKAGVRIGGSLRLGTG
jgi:hypothetical protein